MDDWKTVLMAGGPQGLVPAGDRAGAPPSDAPLLPIEQYDLGGIPVFHLPAPPEAPTTLGLVFALGRAHEPVALGGISHVAAHLLVPAGLTRADHDAAATHPANQTFRLRGDPSEVTLALTDLCRAIEAPSFDGFDDAVEAVRAETDQRERRTIAFEPLHHLLGYDGFGAIPLPEFFVHRPELQALVRWMSRGYTAANAAVWICGGMPADLVVPLRPGERTPPPPVGAVPDLVPPTRTVARFPGVAACLPMEPGPAAEVALLTLRTRLAAALRRDPGIGESAGVAAIPLGGEDLVATTWIRCPRTGIRAAERTLLQLIDDVAARGPSDDELEAQIHRLAGSLADPHQSIDRLEAHVRDHLLGGPAAPPHPEDVLAAWRDVEPAAAAVALARAREAMVVAVGDPDAGAPRPFEPYPRPRRLPARGAKLFEIAVSGWSSWARGAKPTLSVGENGVGIEVAGGPEPLVLAAVPWSECVAVATAPGARTLLTRDGRRAEVMATDWKNGIDALKLIDKLAPERLVVPASAPAGVAAS